MSTSLPTLVSALRGQFSTTTTWTETQSLQSMGLSLRYSKQNSNPLMRAVVMAVMTQIIDYNSYMLVQTSNICCPQYSIENEQALALEMVVALSAYKLYKMSRYTTLAQVLRLVTQQQLLSMHRAMANSRVSSL